MCRLWLISDGQWEVLKGIVYRQRGGGVARSAQVLWARQTVWERHRARMWDGALDAVYRALTARTDARSGLDWDACVDSCVVRAHQRATNTSCRTGARRGCGDRLVEQPSHGVGCSRAGAGTAQGAGSPARSPSRKTRKRPGADAGAKAGATTPSPPPPAPSAPSSSRPSRPTSNGGHWPPATDALAIVHTAGLLIHKIHTRPAKETHPSRATHTTTFRAQEDHRSVNSKQSSRALPASISQSRKQNRRRPPLTDSPQPHKSRNRQYRHLRIQRGTKFQHTGGETGTVYSISSFKNTVFQS